MNQFDELVLISNIFFAVGALLLQWALIDPNGPRPAGHDKDN